jgi:hypothetical protein
MQKLEYRLSLILSGLILFHVLILFACIVRAKLVLGHWPDMLADHSPSSVLGKFFYIYMASSIILFPSLFLWVGVVLLGSIQYRTLFGKWSIAMVFGAVGLYMVLSYLPGSSFEWLFD